MGNPAEQKVDIKVALCESHHPSKLRYLLVPTVSDGEHPLVVDEHTAAEVVSVVKGGHERTGVRRALPSADDLAIPAGNCRNCTRTQKKQQEKKVTCCPLGCRPKCVRVSVCLYVHTSLPAAPSISSSRASSLMVSDERSKDTWTHPGLALYACTTTPSFLNSCFFGLFFFFAVVDHLCPLTVFPLGTNLQPRSNLLSGFGQIAQAVGSCVVRKKSSVVPGWKF